MRKMTITPNIARQMLEKNVGNRPVSKDTVEHYARLMQNGEWSVTPDAIGFDITGRLINGQHRLMAIIKSNTAQTFFVVDNLPWNAFSVTDEGRKRSASDILSIGRKIKNCTTMASIIRSYVILSKGSRSEHTGNKAIAPNNEQVLKKYDEHPYVFDKICDVAMRYNAKLNILKKSEIGSIFAYLVLDKNYRFDYVKYFFDELFYGNNGDYNISLLKERLIKDRLNNYTIKYATKLSLIAKVWNAYVEGKTYKVLRYNQSEGSIEFK